MLPPNSHPPEPVVDASPAGSAVVPSRVYPPVPTAQAIVPVPAVLSATPNLKGLLSALRRRWLLAATVGLVCAAAAATATWCLLPSKYTAYTRLYVASTEPRVFNLGQADRSNFGFYQRTQMAMAKSRLVLNAALRDPKVAQLSLIRGQIEPVEWLENEIQVDFSLSPEIMQISISGDKPDGLGALVSAVTNAYVREVVDREHNQREVHLQKIRGLSDKFLTDLQSKRDALKEMAEAAGSGNSKTLALKQQFALDRLHQEHTRLLGYQDQLRQMKIELAQKYPRENLGPADITALFGVAPPAGLPGAAAVAAALANATSTQAAASHVTLDSVQIEAAVEEAIKHDKEGIELQKRIDALRDLAERTKATAVRGDQDPRVQNYYYYLKIDQDRLEALHKQHRKSVILQQAAKANRAAQEDYRRRLEQMAIVTKLEKQLKDEVDLLQKEQRTFGHQELDIDQLKDDIARYDALAKTAQTEIERLKADMEAPSRVVKLQDAVTVHSRDEKKRIMGTSMAGIGAFAFVLLGLSWWEFRARRIGTPDEVVHGLGMRLVGALPALPERSWYRMIGSSPSRDLLWHGELNESVDATRTMLLHAARVQGLRVVMVTSATAGEGKTSLASHLAVSLARAGRRTLLVDSDLRKPALHLLFEVPQEPGFANLIRGDGSLADAIRPGLLNGLSLLPAGQLDSAVVQALAQDRVQIVFQELREQFDFVIVDSAPILPVADSLLIGQHVDAVIFSLLRDVSRLPLVYAADQRLATLGIRVLGAVVNGTNSGAYGFSGQYAPQYQS